MHTFQLDPTMSDEVKPTVEYLAEKYNVPVEQARAMDQNAAQQAAIDGLPYETDRPMRSTFDMLRLVHLGNEHGVGWQYMRAMQDELFSGNAAVFEHDTLVRLGKELGIPEDEIRDVSATDRFADAVRADHDAAINLGARGVPSHRARQSSRHPRGHEYGAIRPSDCTGMGASQWLRRKTRRKRRR